MDGSKQEGLNFCIPRPVVCAGLFGFGCLHNNQLMYLQGCSLLPPLRSPLSGQLGRCVSHEVVIFLILLQDGVDGCKMHLKSESKMVL